MSGGPVWAPRAGTRAPARSARGVTCDTHLTTTLVLVDDPEAGVKLIREAKDRAAAGGSVVATTAGVAVAAPMQMER